VLGGDADVGALQELEPARDAEAVHGRDDRLEHVRERPLRVVLVAELVAVPGEGIASFRSMPAENDFSPAAVRIATQRPGSALEVGERRIHARAASPRVNAFIASARLMVMIATRSRFS
jgi:hypothetical protein